MASSSSSEHHPSQQRPTSLVRHNSSFLGAIKNIVRAPLNWFANQDDHEATPGKRRRPLEQQSTEELDAPNDSELGIANGLSLAPPSSAESDDEGTRRSKRMRLHSPPRKPQPYLDPPAASLRRTEPLRRASVIPRASSAMLPSSTSGRATLSPRRHFPVARTMSIDPPNRPLVRHDSSAFNFGPPPLSAESDYDMAVDPFVDGSVPPSPRRSPRPSFRMRSSVTPQPQFSRPPMRYISEPPPLNSLISNPVFVHPPTQSLEPTPPTPTLGSLVDSVRATKSPGRQQHSSLLFLSNQNSANNENKDPPAERALHQLDIYKTPLLPTRMRSSNLPESITAKTTPDMFTSRRRKRLVLMSDDKDRLGKKGTGQGKSPVTNETKPYAGDGVLRKLLARRKQETEDEDQQPEKEGESNDIDDSPRASQPSPPHTTRTIPSPPVPTGSDWFSTAASGSSTESGSSLRVGRTKTSRNHIQRPAKTRFSAVYEEDGDDNMDDVENERQREFKMLEESAKKAPVFSIPAGFSFAKDTAGPVNTAELEKAKDPPLTSLPFSLTKPAGSSRPPSAPAAFPSFGTSCSDKVTSSSSAITAPPSALASITEFSRPQASTFFSVPDVPPAPASSGVPNFFANSTIVKETPMPTAPTALEFSTMGTSTGPSGFFSLKPKPAPTETPSKIFNDTENPFWEGGDKKSAQEAKSDLGVFGGFVKKPTNSDSAQGSLTSAFGDAPSVFAPQSKAAGQPTPSVSLLPQQPFSFGKPAQDDILPSSSDTTESTFGAVINTASEVPKLQFSFGAPPAEAKKSDSGVPNSKPIFSGNTATNNLFGDVTKSSTTINLFGDGSKPAATNNLFGHANKSPQPTSIFGPSAASRVPSPPASFNFNAPATQTTTTTPSAPAPSVSSSQPNFFGTSATTTPATEPPKTLFGGSTNAGAFNFGQPASSTEKKEDVKEHFSFAGGPSTPTSPAAPKPTMFSFGQSTAGSPATPVPSTNQSPTPVAFSFSGGSAAAASASADISNKQIYMFGQSNPVAPTEGPVTPPKNNDSEFRMEESPTRELQQVNRNKLPEARPTIGGGAFSFGNSSTNTAGSSLFGGTQNSSPSGGPFNFGGPAPSNPFAQKGNKVEEAKPFGGFGQSTAPVAPAIQTSFSFGQPVKSPEDSQLPNTSGGFSGFGVTPTSATAPTNNAFSFGASVASNPFGQPAATASAPSSPSTFNQPSPFSFGAPTAAPTGGFSFGSSQPASPASGGNLSLPPSGFGSGGGFGQPTQQQQQPSSPFSAPALLTPSTSSGGGANLFTIGAAPPQQPQSGAGRAIKKLPNRRGGVKR